MSSSLDNLITEVSRYCSGRCTFLWIFEYKKKPDCHTFGDFPQLLLGSVLWFPMELLWLYSKLKQFQKGYYIYGLPRKCVNPLISQYSIGILIVKDLSSSSR